MKGLESLTQWRRLTAAVAVAACLLVILLAWLGYVAVREWQRSVAVRAAREAEEASGLLVGAVTRNMRAVQRSILSSPTLNAVTLRPPYQAFNLIAGAFARYQYPESFILWRRDVGSGSAALLLHRRDRLPAWARPVDDPRRFPLRVENDAPIAHRLLERIRADGTQGRQFSAFETAIDGSRYQVVARLFYTENLDQEIDLILGFTVNLDWVRQHYFPALLQEPEWTRGTRTDVLLTIADDRGQHVADTRGRPSTESASSARRTFPLMFFNPQVIAADPPPDLPRVSWVVQAALREDSSLAAAFDAGNRMLILQVIAAGALALGVLLTVRASRAKLKLAHLQSDFVSSVTHEFKTPIATIQAAGESLAAGRIDGSVARQEYAGYIVQEARRLARLVDNLLTFSRVTDSAVTPHPFEPVALADLVTETLQRFAIHLEEGKFTVRVEMPLAGAVISGDRSGIELMLDNLIDNAIRHSRTGRELRVAARNAQGKVVLEVADLGGGIAEDELPHVTRRFYRGRNAGQGGTGLGLAIAHRIVTDHGGTMAIQSDRGRGTTVTITFPAMPVGDAERAPSITSAVDKA